MASCTFVFHFATATDTLKGSDLLELVVLVFHSSSNECFTSMVMLQL
jgi:hypothetical protein